MPASEKRKTNYHYWLSSDCFFPWDGILCFFFRLVIILVLYFAV